MNTLESPVIVVSAFGRGHWIAADLAQKGLKTFLIDVSSALGVWPSEDIEGPFGLFMSEKITPLQLERLNSEDAYQELPNGFTFWLPEGPFELKGPLTKFKLEKSHLHPSVQDQVLTGTNKFGKSLYRNLRSLKFPQSWLLHMSHQLAGTSYQANAKSASVGDSLSLFAPFSIKKATRSGAEKSLEWLQSKNVEILKPQKLVDIAFSSGKQIEGIEISGERAGLIPAEQVVWTLTSEETHFLNPKIGQYFFPQGALESEWSWVRFRLQFESCFERDHLPIHMVLVDDLESPWTHENLMVLQKTGVAEQFDGWIRLPSVQRFNKEYLVARGERMLSRILARVPALKPQILTYPQEYYYTYSQLGAPRFPVYALRKSRLRGRSRFQNLHLDGPELWSQYSWNIYFSQQDFVSSKIENWWKKKLLKEAKNSRKDLQS